MIIVCQQTEQDNGFMLSYVLHIQRIISTQMKYTVAVCDKNVSTHTAVAV